MQIFISYASEDYELADQVHLALSGRGHKVFFDKESLPPSGDYHTRIRNAVEHSDIFVFLISPNSVAVGSYALTELKYARAKWPHPKGRVLPVVLQEVAWEQIPSFLKAVTVLEPKGNAAAETLVAVSEMMTEVGEEELSTQTIDSSYKHVGSYLEIEKAHKITVPVLVAVIGLVGALGAATIANWDKLFPSESDVAASNPSAEANRLPESGGLQSTAKPSTATAATMSDEAAGFLKELFSMWTIGGTLDEWILSAFSSLMVLDGNENPKETMQEWIKYSKVKASNATGIPVSEFGYLEIELSFGAEPLTLEDSFYRLWKRSVERSKPSNMAKVRLALIQYLGEERQQELIGEWNERIR